MNFAKAAIASAAALAALGGLFAAAEPEIKGSQTLKRQIDQAARLKQAKIDPAAPVKELTLGEQHAIMKQLARAREKERIKQLRRTIPAAEWIDIAYHGQLFDANYQLLAIDAATALEIQDSLYAILSKAAEPKRLESQGAANLKAFYAEGLAPEERLILRSSVIEELLKATPQKFSARYAWRHQLLQREIRVLSRDYIVKFRPEVLRRLREYLLPHDWFLPIEPSNAYNDGCRAESVPVPPDFPHADWKSQGVQSIEFISTSLTAEVFAYKHADGVCYALPRTSGATYTDGGSVSLLGVICQSEATGKACFWDNRDATGSPISGPGVTLDFATIQNGSNLNENCTSCHRGRNAFNIHPGTMVDLSRATAVGGPYDTMPATPYSPMGSNAYGPWVNPWPLALPAGAGCTACHTAAYAGELADTVTVLYGDGARRGGYCDILRQAAQTTMPPPGGASAAGWPAPMGSLYRAHVEFLRARCP